MNIRNDINHIAFVLDASGSMHNLAMEVIKVTDAQIKYLATRSQDLDQETRVSVYTFSYRHLIKCLVYDKDVLRLPSIQALYKPDGSTALIDATLKALDDLSKTPELYGEHSFLLYVLTDGQENASAAKPNMLTNRIAALPEHWTLAAFTPDQIGVRELKQFGFPSDNIAIWNAASVKGVEEVGERIRTTTDSFMKARAAGVRGYKNLFNLDLSKVSSESLKNLTRLGPGQFRILKVDKEEAIALFVERHTLRPYKLGEAYYQLTKPVEVQPQKIVAIYDRKAYSVYTGGEARKLLGLDVNHTVKVAPASIPNYDVFVQSTSVNRKLFPGTAVLLLS